MNNIDKAQYKLEGKCIECGLPNATHVPSKCGIAASEFGLKMKKILIDSYKVQGEIHSFHTFKGS